VRLGRLRPQANGLAELDERVVPLALLPQDRAQLVVGLRVVRLRQERLPKGGGRFLRPAGLPEHHTQRVGGLRQLGARVEVDGASQGLFGAREVVLLLERHPQVVEGLGGGGIGRGQLAIHRHRAVEIALLQERAAQVVARGAMRRILGQHLSERGHRGVALAGLHQREPQRVASVRGARIERDGPVQGGDRAFEVSPLAQGGAELQVGRRQARIQTHGPAQIRHRRRQVARLLPRQSQVVPRFGMRRLQPDRLAQLRKGAHGVARPPERGAQVIAGVEEARVELRGLAEGRDRVLRATLLAADESEAVVDLGATRRVAQGRIVGGCGAGEVAGLLAQPSEHVVGVRRGRVECDRALELRPRFGHAVLLEERDPFGDRVGVCGSARWGRGGARERRDLGPRHRTQGQGPEEQAHGRSLPLDPRLI
jgi:hypothetical protein